MNTSPNETEKRRTNDPAANPDPITGEPGAHPVGTGAGAAGGGVAGAAIGTMAGPIGAVAGAVIGAVAGGLAGKGVGEAMNPTEEAAHWQQHHSKQPYAAGSRYDDYADAYRSGYEGHEKYSSKSESFEGAEPFIREDYAAFQSPLEWERARPAATAAWKRRAEAAEHRSSYPGMGV